MDTETSVSLLGFTARLFRPGRFRDGTRLDKTGPRDLERPVVPGLPCASQKGQIEFKKKHRQNLFFCTFFQSTHQVGMKNVVKGYKDFFGYFNALKTHCDLYVNGL